MFYYRVVFLLWSDVVTDYSSHSEASIAYCVDVTEVRFGEGREIMQTQTSSNRPVSHHEVREYYISRDISLSGTSAEDAETPHFLVQSSSGELELQSSEALPPYHKHPGIRHCQISNPLESGKFDKQ